MKTGSAKSKDHPFVLRKIELTDFKSIGQSKVELSPLTVVVGANSSGKSTLLQSILAVVQGSRARSHEGEFPLNGRFVRLGTFGETKKFGTEQPDSPIQISVTLLQKGFRQLRRPSDRKQRSGEVIQITWSMDLCPDKLANSGFALLRSVLFKVDKLKKDEVKPWVTCEFSQIASESDMNEIPVLSAQHAPFGMESASMRTEGTFTDWETGRSFNCDASGFIGAIPRTVYERTSLREAYAGHWWDEVSEHLAELIKYEETLFEGEDLERPRRSFAAVKYAYEDIRLLHVEGEQTRGDGVRLWHRMNWLRGMILGINERLSHRQKSQQKTIAKSMAQIGKEEFLSRVVGKLKGERWSTDVVLNGPYPDLDDLLSFCGRPVHRFFERDVQYLGPLREAPRALYEPGPKRRDLGINGEYAAVVLQSNADTKVLLPKIDGTSEGISLTAALDYWLKEFGIADSANTKDRGRLGIALEVAMPSIGRSVDLTSVGVGVSQVLPVLLICLLAGPGELVILEQPELHLHPALQHKLADFLLECTRSGRQLIVETHSEHLINRLRRRVVEDETEQTESLVGLLFAEQRDGSTQYRASSINRLGGLREDWPDGFLDLGSQEAQSLVRTSLDKRRRERN
jgi:predicted ATPase